MKAKNLIALIIGVCAALFMAFMPVNAQEEEEPVTVRIFNYIDNNGNNEYDTGDTHIRWGIFNYRFYEQDGTTLNEGTFYIVNSDYIYVSVIVGDVFSLQRVHSCDPALFWTYYEIVPDPLYMKWSLLDGSCENPSEPIVDFESYKVNLPFITFR